MRGAAPPGSVQLANTWQRPGKTLKQKPGFARPRERRPETERSGRHTTAARRPIFRRRYVIGGKEFSTEQVVGLVFGFYCVLGFLGTRGGSKKEESKVAESAPAASGSVVSMLDDGFEAWAANPSNMKKWEDSIAEMK